MTLTQPVRSLPALSSRVIPDKGTGIFSYLAITFGLTWAAYGLIWSLGIAKGSGLWTFVAGLAGFAPAIAAIVVRQWITREGFRDAGLWPKLLRKWPYYAFALLTGDQLVAV